MECCAIWRRAASHVMIALFFLARPLAAGLPYVRETPVGADASWRRLLLGAGLMVGYFLVLVAWPLDRFFTSFVPVPERLPLLLAILVGTLPYFLVDEWLTRGAGARQGAYAFTKTLFLLSLGMAVALDFESLFFLILIVPFVFAFFLVHGLLSRWVCRSTGSPLVAGLGNAVAFAWALAVTFPMYAGG